jgi:hypothetical protein
MEKLHMLWREKECILINLVSHEYHDILHVSGLTSKALTHFLLALTKTSWDVQALVHAAKLAYQLGAENLFYELSERYVFSR